MDSALQSIAGHDQDRERDACKEALRPHIARLLREGMQPASIITALAELTVFTIDREGWQLN
jgi:hypothetical protein